jgi:hypothetical protein
MRLVYEAVNCCWKQWATIALRRLCDSLEPELNLVEMVQEREWVKASAKGVSSRCPGTSRRLLQEERGADKDMVRAYMAPWLCSGAGGESNRSPCCRTPDGSQQVKAARPVAAHAHGNLRLGS